MKTLQKLKLNQVILTAEELRQLKGGDDINNNNTTAECQCYYSNKTRVITNNNSVDNCRCYCNPY